LGRALKPENPEKKAANESGHIEQVSPQWSAVFANDHCPAAHGIGVEEHSDHSKGNTDSEAGFEVWCAA